MSKHSNLQRDRFLTATGLAVGLVLLFALNILSNDVFRNAVGDRTVAEESTLSFIATASDIDDPANSLTWSLIGAPPGASINPGNGQFTWTPPAGAAGDYTVTIKVVDNGSPALSDTETITITVSS